MASEPKKTPDDWDEINDALCKQAEKIALDSGLETVLIIVSYPDGKQTAANWGSYGNNFAVEGTVKCYNEFASYDSYDEPADVVVEEEDE